MKTAVARVLVAAAVLFGMAWSTAGAAAAADCPAPSISVNPNSGRGGDTFVINGHNFFAACSDAGNTGDTGVQLRFIQGSNVFDLGSATAGSPDGDFSGRLFVPTNTSAGGATVQAFGQNGAPAVPFTVTASTLTTAATAPATTRTTAAPAVAGATSSTVAPPTTASSSTTSTTASGTSNATTPTTAVAAASTSSGGLNGAGLAITIALLALVVLGTIGASLATAGRLPLPGRHRRQRGVVDPLAPTAVLFAAPAAAPAAASVAPDVADATAPIELINPFEPEEPVDGAGDTPADEEPTPDAAEPADEPEAGAEGPADGAPPDERGADEVDFPEEPKGRP
jgi:hypothetical protein